MIQKEDLPNRWKVLLESYLSGKPYLEVTDFNTKSVAITFEDNSYLKFNNILFIESATYDEIGVFTEHCGYFIFSNSSITKIKFEGYKHSEPENIKLQQKIDELCKDKPYYISFYIGSFGGDTDKKAFIYIGWDDPKRFKHDSVHILEWCTPGASLIEISRSDKTMMFDMKQRTDDLLADIEELIRYTLVSIHIWE